MRTKKAPVATSERKRPNKTFILQMAEFNKFMTGNQKTQLATLDVRNLLQRINNRAMSEETGIKFTAEENSEIQHLIKEFVKSVDEIIKNKKN